LVDRIAKYVGERLTEHLNKKLSLSFQIPVPARLAMRAKAPDDTILRQKRQGKEIGTVTLRTKFKEVKEFYELKIEHSRVHPIWSLALCRGARIVVQSTSWQPGCRGRC
jgi:hypothetical protein